VAQARNTTDADKRNQINALILNYATFSTEAYNRMNQKTLARPYVAEQFRRLRDLVVERDMLVNQIASDHSVGVYDAASYFGQIDRIYAAAAANIWV
jgi:hypothetical protein